MEIVPDIETFREWVPIRVYREGEEFFVDWCHMGTERFTRPFFEDSVNARLRRPFSLLFRRQTPIEFLGKIYEGSRGVRPAGFIFHTSRCGSTLVSQMLASAAKNIVISEPPPIDSILRADTGSVIVSDEIRITWLRWIVNAFGQMRDQTEERLFVKFDSWSTTELGLIRRAFPDVPWIFLYRSPLEVIVSQMDQRGVHMVPGLIPGILPGVSTEHVLQIQHEEYCARVLERICLSALENTGDRQGLFVNYSELPGAVTAKIAGHFGLDLSGAEIEEMNSATRFNAKTPQLDFEPDTERKNRSATHTARAAARLLDPLYIQLEEISQRAA